MIRREVLACFAVLLCVYVMTAANAPQFGDNAEFLTAGAYLGVCHNPGYPVQSLAGHALVAFLPLGTMSYRGNLLSALLGALTGAVLMGICLRMKLRLPAAICAVGVVMLGPLFWSQATLAEVYTADGLITALCLMTLLAMQHWVAGGLLLAFLLGLAPVIHLSQILYLPAFAAARLALVPAGRRLQTILRGVPFFLLGLSVWIYLPTRQLGGPIPNVGNPAHWIPFLNLISGSAHRRFMVMSLPWEASLARVPGYFQHCILPTLTVAGLVMVMTGLMMLLKKRTIFTCLIFWIVVANMSYGAFLNQVPLDATPFGIPALVAMVIPMAFFWDWLLREARKHRIGRLIQSVCLLVAGLPLVLNFSSMNRSKDFQAFRFSSIQLEGPPPDSPFLVQGDDDLFLSLHLQTVYKFRPDVHWVDCTGVLGLGPLQDPARYPDSAAFFEAFQKLEMSIAKACNCKLVYAWQRSTQFVPAGLNFAVPKIADRTPSWMIPQYLLRWPADVGKDFQLRRAMARFQFQYAWILIRNNQPEEAKKHLLAGLGWGRDISSVLTGAANIYLELNQVEAARDLLTKATSLEPDNEEAWMNLSKVWILLNKPQEAKAAQIKYQKLLKRHFK